MKDSILAILLEEDPEYPVYYVDQSATGAGNGSSWENAFTELQPAIDIATQIEGWVWVAGGTYGAITLKSRVMLFGGFSGEEEHLSDRDTVSCEAVIRGYVGTGGNGRRAVDMEHLTLIDGFTIRDSGYRGTAGQLADNVAGGGIRTMSWFSIIRNNRILNNYAKGGGGIAIWGRHDYQRIPDYAPIVERNIIYENHGNCGAGVQIRQSEALFTNNVVFHNRDHPDPGQPDKSKGVEIVIDPSISGRPTVVNSILWDNSAGAFPDLYNHVDFTGTAKSLYNCIKTGGYGEGLITDDPRFENPTNGDFQLQKGSPCIDAGYPGAPLDPDGTRADIGTHVALHYQLIIDDGGVGANSVGGGWYFPDTLVTISTDSVVFDSFGTTRYSFLCWEGEGSGSYTGDSLTATVAIDGHITERIVWQVSYWLQVNSGSETDSLSGWYDADTVVTLTVPALMEVGEGERRWFISWSGEGAGSQTSTEPSITVKMQGPVVETAFWETEYYVKVVSEYGNPRGGGWYDADCDVTIAVDTVEVMGEGRRYRFVRWEGEGVGAYTGSADSFEVALSGPIVEIAVWKQQFYLTVLSERGNPQGEAWYDADSVVTILVDTVEVLDEGSRYHFWGWEGSGLGSYDGTDPSPSIQMLGPVTETAVWKREYWISIAIDPPEGGDVVPFSSPGEWWVDGEVITLRAVENADSGFGFVSWSGDTSSTVNPLVMSVVESLSLTAHFELGDVTVLTDPLGLIFSADSLAYHSPRIFYWLPEEKHRIGVDSLQEGAAQVRYVFDSWSDGGDREHEIEIPADPEMYTAYFEMNYFLKIESEYGTSVGEGWYGAGREAFVSIDSIVADTSGVRQLFSEWTGTGEGSVESSEREITVVVNGPIVQTAHWKPQYYLDVKAFPSYGGTVRITPPDLWYDGECEVLLEAVEADTNFTFVGWSGDISDSTNPVTVVMDSPKWIVANFTTSTVFPPQFLGIPDTTIHEDEALILFFSSLSRYVMDPNDPVDSLRFFLVEGAHFSLEVDTGAGELRFLPEPNWNGAEEITLEAVDPWGLSDSTTFEVTVLPVADAPEPFWLLLPPDGTVLSDTVDLIEFVWEEPVDVDSGDTMGYDFFIGPDSSFTDGSTIRITSLTDTTLLFSRDRIDGMFYWGVKATDVQGLSTWSSERWRLSVSTDVEGEEEALPGVFVLYQNFPNPFNSETQITYRIPEPGRVRLEVFDVRGRHVRTLVDREQGMGRHTAGWEGRDDGGKDLASGMYVVQLSMDRVCIRKKVILLR